MGWELNGGAGINGWDDGSDILFSGESVYSDADSGIVMFGIILKVANAWPAGMVAYW
jgi:hypothetical protein